MEIKAAAVAVSSRPEFFGPSALNSAGTSAQTASPANDSKEAAAIYVSPAIRFDQLARVAVIYYRDAETGETRDQIPPKKIVEEYRRNGGRNLGEFAKSAAEKVTSPLETTKVETTTGGNGKFTGSTVAAPSAGTTSDTTSVSTTTVSTTEGGDSSSFDVSAPVASSGGNASSGSVVSLTV